MASCKTRDFVSSLKSKGFRRDAERDRHLVYRLWVDNKRTSIRTMVSKSEKDFSDPMIKARRDQMGLSKKDFLDFVACPLSAEDYVSQLADQDKL